jgi:hypothetical protein
VPIRALTRARPAKPVIYWTPVIAPGNFIFYKGDVSAVAGSALISGIARDPSAASHSMARAAPRGTLGHR